MIKDTYVIFSCPKNEFVRACKEGAKLSIMTSFVYCVVSYVEMDKSSAIRDCRTFNLHSRYSSYFYVPVRAFHYVGE